MILSLDRCRSRGSLPSPLDPSVGCVLVRCAEEWSVSADEASLNLVFIKVRRP